MTRIANFRSGLFVQDNDGLPYTLLFPLVYDSAILNRTITVPRGFNTDLASIPRVFWITLPKSGKYDRAAVVHDFLYAHNGVTRKQADDVLKEAMEVLGVGQWTRWKIYAGVRLGGMVPWNRYRREETREQSV